MTGYLLLFGSGLIAGVINVIAGGGSFLTLPILMFLGLPAGIANGTNRVGILLQNVAAVWSFERHRVLDWSSLGWAAGPATLGAILGTWGALVISDQAFRRVLVLLMLTVSVWTLWSPHHKKGDNPTDLSTRSRWHYALTGLAFFAVGIYGGFVQAGVGFFILAVTSAVGLNLVRGNAVKVLTVLCFTALSLALFAWQGKAVTIVLFAVKLWFGG